MRTLDARDIDILPFLKRAGFAAEEEYRVIGFSKEERDVIHVPLRGHVIRRITLSPFLHPALVQSTIDAIHNIKGWENLPVIHSRLTDSRTWERRLHAFMKRHYRTQGVTGGIERGLADFVAGRVVQHEEVTAGARAVVADAKRAKK
jgi:predicted transcriptional regulator